jgi:hypothetical protein
VWIRARWNAADGDDQPRLLVVAQVHAGIFARVAVLGLVLQRDGVDRDAGAPVVLDEAHEVARVRVVDPRIVLEAPADERVVGLHPRGRAPRRGHHLQVRVQPQRLAQERQDLRAVVGDREVLQAEVGPPRGDVVVGVVRARDEVRGAHRLAQVAESEAAARVEERTHDRVAVGRMGEQMARGVGDRGAEALDALVGAGRIDGDGRRGGVGRAKSGRRLLGEQARSVAGGQPGAHAGAVGERRGGARERDDDGENEADRDPAL